MGKEVDPSEYLYRGIGSNVPGGELYKLVDKEKGIYRPTSLAFRDKRGELSVDIASKTTPEESFLRRPQNRGLVSFQASIPISFNYRVIEDPIVNNPGISDNPAHGLVLSGGEPMSKKICREIAQKCTWEISPSNI